ncbi:MAG: hypothetical protein KDA22_14280 [Phycisphaerales bacterium]|nr:hypothetical protein [Phycisphaerales bacterium]
MAEPNLIDLQRDAVALLRALVHETATEERRIVDAFANARAAAAEQFRLAEAAAIRRFDAERESSTAQHHQQLEELEQSTSSRRDLLQRQWKAAVERTEAKAIERRKASAKGKQEAVWLAETVHEATSKQPHEVFEQTGKGLDGFLRELDATEQAAIGHLRRYRQPVPRDAADATIELPPSNPEAALPSKSTLESAATAGREGVERLRRMILPRLFLSGLPVVLLLLPAAIAGGLGYLQADLRMTSQVWVWAGGGLAVAAGALAVAYAMSRSRVHAVFRPIAAAVRAGREAVERCRGEAQAIRDRQLAEINERFEREVQQATDTHSLLQQEIEASRERHLHRAETEFPPRVEAIEREYAEHRATIERQTAECLEHATAQRDEALAAATTERDRCLEDAAGRHRREWSALVERWQSDSRQAEADLARVREAIGSRFPAVDDESAWDAWRPPSDVLPAVPVGWFELDLEADAGALPQHPDLSLSGPAVLRLPALLAFPDACSFLARAAGTRTNEAVELVRSAMFRLLVAAPPGKARFVIIDPVGLGQNFAGFMHLSDYDGALVGDRIWTEERHIDQRLLDVTEHMENVIQKYLRNRYETIAAYNADAGEIAEPYRFVVVAHLPVNFSESAARRLASIAASGPRCGVFTLVAADTKRQMPQGFRLEDLAAQSACADLVESDGGAGWVWGDDAYQGLELRIEPPPSDELLNRLLHRIGSAAQEASRVEVPFACVAPEAGMPDEGGTCWSRDCTSELRVALGRAGATKLQELSLGRGVSQHVLVAGKTGSGKSTLLHALITNTALWYPPEQVEFYLVDFKKGVEFRTYAAHELPHARVVAIESDREFGLSVLQRLDVELRRRGELYRDLGVQDLAGFRRLRPDDRMPRTLLVIDEFQEFFTEDDKVAQDASLLLDRLVRQGRAFGIHVLLGSQTLGGAYSLARSTIGQMAVRIALQCSESDSYLILSDDNAAARLLSRPGEAIYNDQGGLVEGNNPFQIVWLDDEERDRLLDGVETMAQRSGFRRTDPLIVFEGNVPAHLDRNAALESAIESGGSGPPQAWLGEAIAIKEPPAAIFRRQSGANLLLVGQRDDAALAMLEAAALALAVQGNEPPDLWILDGTAADAPNAERLPRLAALLESALPGRVHAVPYREVPEAMAALHAELERRQGDESADQRSVFVLVNGLQRFRMLRQQDDFGFSPSFDAEATPQADKQFGTLLREGPVHGMHTLAWIDTVANLNRALDRQAMREFEQRVLFQMGGTDSSQLIDSPAATRLGLHRAILFSEESGVMEKFRPYGLADEATLQALVGRVRAVRSA